MSRIGLKMAIEKKQRSEYYHLDSRTSERKVLELERPDPREREKIQKGGYSPHSRKRNESIQDPEPGEKSRGIPNPLSKGEGKREEETEEVKHTRVGGMKNRAMEKGLVAKSDLGT